jgi:septal ring factor EnvC (AmiA/AmiB activator)
MRRGATILLLTAGALLALAAAGTAESLDGLRQRCQEVRLQLAAEKARVVREDSEAAALREQIERLYRELDRLVSAKPTVARLQADLARLDDTIKAQEASARTARPQGKTTP